MAKIANYVNCAKLHKIYKSAEYERRKANETQILQKDLIPDLILLQQDVWNFLAGVWNFFFRVHFKPLLIGTADMNPADMVGPQYMI